jgi:hypothetical protein
MISTTVVAGAVAAGLFLSGCSSDSDDKLPVVDAPTCPFGGVSNDEVFYGLFANAFVGLNPVVGDGSGFFYNAKDMRTEEWGVAPVSNTGRSDLCTCDCKPSPDGLGCAGYGGIQFRYISHLSAAGRYEECARKEWFGQMVAEQCAGGGACELAETAADESTASFWNWIGEDRRMHAGSASYRVAGVSSAQSSSGGADDVASLHGVFRQMNGPLSCGAGIADKQASTAEPPTKEAKKSCWMKCEPDSMYRQWVAYCEASTENKLLGFTGYNVGKDSSL